MKKKKQLIGLTFGKLKVVKELEKKGKHLYWECQCECGNIIRKATTALIHNTKYEAHCGCMYKENLSKAMKGKPQGHGQTINGIWTADYRIYRAMISRCKNPNVKAYKDYGGRGITICDRWLNGENGESGFICFTKDMGKRPDGLSIDRIDFNGNYCPENCRWANSKTQGQNTRSTKLTMEQAREIRFKFSLGNISKSQLARDYKISNTNVHDILNNRIWKE